MKKVMHTKNVFIIAPPKEHGSFEGAMFVFCLFSSQVRQGHFLVFRIVGSEAALTASCRSRNLRLSLPICSSCTSFPLGLALSGIRLGLLRSCLKLCLRIWQIFLTLFHYMELLFILCSVLPEFVSLDMLAFSVKVCFHGC